MSGGDEELLDDVIAAAPGAVASGADAANAAVLRGVDDALGSIPDFPYQDT